MREVLFRGKQKDNGEWVEGFLVPITVNCYDKGYEIIDKDGIEYDELDCYNPVFSADRIDPSTVGQFTGLYDKNDNKIFEGDIVKGKDFLEKALEIYGYIDHRNGSFVIVGDFMTHYRWLDYEVEVIGNVHDNLELLEEGAEE